MNITFPDGSVREYESGTSAITIAKGISKGLAKKVMVAKVNGEICDLLRPIEEDAALELLSFDDEDGRKTFWHSSAHLLAEALEQVYPGVKLGIGPAIDGGFYYDIDLGDDRNIGQEDLTKIENTMRKLVKFGNKYERKEISKADAIAYFEEKGDEYKLELLEDLEDGDITFYTQGNFTDLCKGPHIPGTGQIKAIKLLNIAGAYWRGDEKRKQMTRIYGVSFPNQELLQAHLHMLEEAKKRDHRKLGAELELFMFSERVGAGLPIWLPKGADLRERLSNYLKNEQVKRGYQPVVTPHIGKKDLYVTSGHYEKYGEDSFQAIQTPREDEEFLLKPMNCPHHCEVYAHIPKSYRDLPYRVAEFGTVYRYEQSGELHGLTRVRGFTQDDAHIFCTADQLKDEFLNVLDLTTTMLKKLSFTNYTAQISLRDPYNPDKYIGSTENWDKAEQAIIEATQEVGMTTVTELGEAAFYGPKLDFMIKDALGRSWQLGTIQVDYNLPERFELEYIGADNEKHRPIMIHRAPFGSLERFIGVLIEHTAGKFPLWLAPEQAVVLPISEKFNDYSAEVVTQLKQQGIRVSLDERYEKIGKKIRDAEVMKIPYMLIIGEKEMTSKEVSIRKQAVGDLGSKTIGDFAGMILEEADSE